MEQYINKSALVAEIDKRKIGYNTDGKHTVEYNTVKKILDILDTLEVKEIHEDIDMDLNHLFEEMGVEPDSRIALMFKNAFYKSVDNYLDKKEDKL